MDHDDPDTALQRTELAGLSSVKAISRVAAPAILMNAAPPITAAVQTALLGSLASTDSLAAFAAVGTCVGLVCRVANFLVDGVSSKVGRSVGQRHWRQLTTHIQLSLRWSVLLGAAAVPLLLAARIPMCSWLLGLSQPVQQQAAGYWRLRTGMLPLQLLNMSATGILQGFGRVQINAALTSAAAVLEMLGSALVLRMQHQEQQRPPDDITGSGSLMSLGWVTLVSQALLAAAALACIVALPPPEARGRVNLVRDVLGSRRSSSRSLEADEPCQGLLADRAAAGQQASGDAGAGASNIGTVRALHGSEEEHGDPQRAEGPAMSKLGIGLFDEATREFLRDGLAMFVRTLMLQLTFFLALAAAAKLGTAALAAHSIIGQLWVVISYAVDGFAAAGIVLGSRLAGFARDARLRSAAKGHMQLLINRVLLAGAASGSAAGLAFACWRDGTIALFSRDPAVVAELQHGVWMVLALAQPLNGLLFVGDGLMYASQNFTYVRDMMVLGFLLIFCPLIGLEYWLWPSLTAIWLAKAALNVWRLAGAGYLIFFLFMAEFDGGAAASELDSAAPAEP